MALLRDFVDCHRQDAGLPPMNYGLATHYPMRELDGELLERTVAEAHLNGEVVYVHDLDAYDLLLSLAASARWRGGGGGFYATTRTLNTSSARHEIYSADPFPQGPRI